MGADLSRSIIEAAEDAAQAALLRHALTLFTILEDVKFPKGTKLRSGEGGALEVVSPGVPVYEIRMKEML